MDLAAPIRAAIMAEAAITNLLPTYKGSKPVFTRRPPPEDAPYPMILISPDITLGNEDGLVSMRPVIMRDIMVYGDQPDHYRDVEAMAYDLRELFHRQRSALTVSGYHVIDIRASGPITGAVDEPSHLSRIVTLTVRVQPT